MLLPCLVAFARLHPPQFGGLAGGTAIAGTYSTQMGMINFSPALPLTSNTTYEVLFPAGGVRDSVGNPHHRSLLRHLQHLRLDRYQGAGPVEAEELGQRHFRQRSQSGSYQRPDLRDGHQGGLPCASARRGEPLRRRRCLRCGRPLRLLRLGQDRLHPDQHSDHPLQLWKWFQHQWFPSVCELVGHFRRQDRFETGNGTATASASTAAGALVFDQWNHLVVSVDRTAGLARIYCNGVHSTVGTAIRTDFATGGTVNLTLAGTGAKSFVPDANRSVSPGAFTVVSGAGALTKDGAGMLTVSGANSYSGGTNVNAGTAVAGSPTAFGTGPVTVGAANVAGTIQPGGVGGGFDHGELRSDSDVHGPAPFRARWSDRRGFRHGFGQWSSRSGWKRPGFASPWIHPGPEPVLHPAERERDFHDRWQLPVLGSGLGWPGLSPTMPRRSQSVSFRPDRPRHPRRPSWLFPRAFSVPPSWPTPSSAARKPIRTEMGFPT